MIDDPQLSDLELVAQVAAKDFELGERVKARLRALRLVRVCPPATSATDSDSAPPLPPLSPLAVLRHARQPFPGK